MNLLKSRKPAIALAALLASVALVACGGDDDSTTSESASAAPEEVTKSFLLALANADGEAACSYATADQVAELEEAGGCDAAIAEQVGEVSDEELQSVEDATYEVTEESDTTATVEATKPDGGATQTFQLTMEDGEWKISG